MHIFMESRVKKKNRSQKQIGLNEPYTSVHTGVKMMKCVTAQRRKGKGSRQFRRSAFRFVFSLCLGAESRENARATKQAANPAYTRGFQ